MTTNCLMPPHDGYDDRLFTASVVGHPELEHLPIIEGNTKFDHLIATALEMPGFTEDEPLREVMTGFGHNAVLNVVPQVVDAVQTGKIRHFFLVGGCDGAKPGRNYYTEFVEQAPDDCVILTLACGKFRFFDQQLGNINGIPRYLDMGQCNDAYSAIQVALALANAFDTDVNQLPLSMVISWYEQKAIAVLLTLLHLGIKNILLGPTLPTFLTPNILNYLSQQYQLHPTITARLAPPLPKTRGIIFDQFRFNLFKGAIKPSISVFVPCQPFSVNQTVLTAPIAFAVSVILLSKGITFCLWGIVTLNPLKFIA